MERASISAFIVCCNEEAQIRRCLQSVAWCDEIVVIDSGSTDATCEICREFGANIHERPWPGYVEQKRFGLLQCTKDLVLNLDADEVISDELRQEIETVLERDKRGEIAESGFELLRVVHFHGRWWRKGGWYPEYRLRLLRRAKASWGGMNPHEHALVDGSVARLSGELSHFTYRDFSDQIRSLNSHSSAAAHSLHAQGESSHFGDLLFRPLGRFFKFYIVRKGYREGRDGFIVAIFEAFYVFLKYAKLLELRGERKK